MVSRDREDGFATGQPQGLASEAYLSSTSQGAGPEDARKDNHMRGRSSQLVNYPGYAGGGQASAPSRVTVRVWKA